jgi:hypothetical protein
VTRLLLGGPYWTGGGPPWPEGVEFNYRCDTHMLVMSLPCLSPREIESVRKAPCEFGVFVEDDVIFFLYRFGDSFAWSESPYCYWMVPEDERTMPLPPTEQERAVLSVILVESNTNRIQAIRMVTLPTTVTRKLHWAILEQSNKPWCGQREYDSRLYAIRRKYECQDMAKIGVTGIGGE